MSSITICFIIALVAIVLYVTEWLPLPLTSLCVLVAMCLTGVLTASEALAGFSNTAVILLIGMMIIGQAFFTTGIAEDIGKALLRLTKGSEKRMIIFLLIIGLSSVVLPSLVIVTTFMPIIDTAVAQSNGKLTRKNTYMPLAISSLFSSNLSVAASSTMTAASGMMADSYVGRPLEFFEPAPVAAIACAIPFITYLTFAHKLEKKVFNFEEAPLAVLENEGGSNDKKQMPTWKKVLTFAVLIGVMVVLATTDLHMGIVMLTGAAILMVAKCIDMKEAYKSLSWPTVFIVAGSLALGKGLEVSGAAGVIANWLIEHLGSIGQIPFVMLVILMVLCTFLSNFMSNTAAVTTVLPIALQVASVVGANPVAFVIGVALAANFAMGTQLSVVTMTVTAKIGYRFKDYLIVGGLHNLLGIIVASISMYLFYFM